jgi:hypothetical protein
MVATSNNYTTIVRTDYLAGRPCQFFPQIERVHVCRGGRVEACIGTTFNFFIKLTDVQVPPTPLFLVLGDLYGDIRQFYKKIEERIMRAYTPLQG